LKDTRPTRIERRHLKVRGIYATALTRLVLDMGYGIAEPSREICRRFGIGENEIPPDLAIEDREDMQGVRILGSREAGEELIRRLWEVLLDMVVRRGSTCGDSGGSGRGSAAWEIEFPGASKAALDGLRDRVLPTMMHHHRLRIIASDYLDLFEGEIARKPQKKRKLEREFLERFLYGPMRKQGLVCLEHVKPEGEVLRLGQGEVLSLEGSRILVRRRFHRGRYDGLDMPIEPGDYGLTETEEGNWSVRHRYFGRGGRPKGEYLNVNTPVEFYPDRIRYVDLHVDVVKRGQGEPRIIDREDLAAITRKRLISSRLEGKALEVSRRLLEELGFSTQERAEGREGSG